MLTSTRWQRNILFSGTNRFSPSLCVMTLLQLFRAAVLRFYYSQTGKQQLVSKKTGSLYASYCK
jgi:hypothetical protein